MKTTVDLPDTLVNEIQRRAVREGRPLHEVVAELLAASLPMSPPVHAPLGELLSKTLPLIKVRPTPPSNPRQLNTQQWCDWIKDMEMQFEVERYEKAFGHQYVDRADP